MILPASWSGSHRMVPSSNDNADLCLSSVCCSLSDCGLRTHSRFQLLLGGLRVVDSRHSHCRWICSAWHSVRLPCSADLVCGVCLSSVLDLLNQLLISPRRSLTLSIAVSAVTLSAFSTSFRYLMCSVLDLAYFLQEQ